MPTLTLDSPFGTLTLVERDGAIAALRFADDGDNSPTPLLRDAAAQLGEYFEGRRRDFDLPLHPAETPFQDRMRATMLAIPYGHTRSYGDIADDLGGAARAVGQACGRNPIPIIVPCHRVVAAGGRLGGFSGGDGLPTKQRLLALEAPDDLFSLDR